jgi:hypothetical protein
MVERKDKAVARQRIGKHVPAAASIYIYNFSETNVDDWLFPEFHVTLYICGCVQLQGIIGLVCSWGKISTEIWPSRLGESQKYRQIMLMSPVGLKSEKGCAGDARQKLKSTDSTSSQKGSPTSTNPKLPKKNWSRVPDGCLTPGRTG